jgi:hypothetical protein
MTTRSLSKKSRPHPTSWQRRLHLHRAPKGTQFAVREHRNNVQAALSRSRRGRRCSTEIYLSQPGLKGAGSTHEHRIEAA